MIRQEEKFYLDFKSFNLLIRRFNLYPKYSSRTINSIYFDTSNFKNYWDGEEGLVPRIKIRYRWYGTNKKQGCIEIKRTYEDKREKEIFEYEYKNINDLTWYINKKNKTNLYPNSIISYQRQYFENIYGLRVTYDSNIQYSRAYHQNKSILSSNIVELKYDITRYNQGKMIKTLFGDRLTRFSKYNLVVSNLYNLI
jgi:hypothetical protein